MKRISIVLIVGLVAFLICPTSSYAGPWTLNKGRAWVEVFGRYMYANHCFDPDGNKSRWDKGAFQEIWDLEGKFEYGVTDEFNLLLSVPYSWSTWKEDAVIHGGKDELHNHGFKEIQVGGKYKFLDKPVVAAVQVKGFIYTYNERDKQPLLSEYGHAIEARGLIGKSFSVYDRPCYFSVESGFKLRAKNMSGDSDWANTVPVFGEMGFSPHDRVMLKGEVDCSISIPGTGRIKDTYTWRAGPIINLWGRGFSSITKGEETSLNVELLYGQTFAGRGDPDIHNDPSWPNSDDRINAAHEFIAKVQLLF